MMFGLYFLDCPLEGFFICKFLLKNLKVRLHVCVDVFCVAFKWVIKYVHAQINLFWFGEQQKLLRIWFLDFVCTDTSPFACNHELTLEFFFFFVEFTAHRLNYGACLARSFRRWLQGIISLFLLFAFALFLVFCLFFVHYDWLGRVIQVDQLRAEDILVK